MTTDQFIRNWATNRNTRDIRARNATLLRYIRTIYSYDERHPIATRPLNVVLSRWNRSQRSETLYSGLIIPVWDWNTSATTRRHVAKVKNTLLSFGAAIDLINPETYESIRIGTDAEREAAQSAFV